MTLYLTRQQSQDVVAHALEEHPNECVGVIVRHVSTHEGRVIRLVNAADDPAETFAVSDKHVARLYHELKPRREYIDVIYHSHTRTPAIPSRRDIDHADLAEAHYLIVATSGRGRALRSWVITDGQAQEERVVVGQAEGPRSPEAPLSCTAPEQGP